MVCYIKNNAFVLFLEMRKIYFTGIEPVVAVIDKPVATLSVLQLTANERQIIDDLSYKIKNSIHK